MSNLKIGDSARIVRVHSEKSLLSYLDRLELNIGSEFKVIDRDMFDESMSINCNGNKLVVSTKALPAVYVIKM